MSKKIAAKKYEESEVKTELEHLKTMLTKYKATNSDWVHIGLNRIEQIEKDLAKKKNMDTVEDTDLYDIVDMDDYEEEEEGDFIEEGEEGAEDEDS